MSLHFSFSNFIKKLKYKILLKNIAPEILGLKDENGKYVPQTGISNVTHVGDKSNFKIGKNVYIGHFNYIDCSKEVIIEDGCALSNYISILTHSSHHNIRFRGQSLGVDNDILLLKKAVFIGKFTYIGPHTVIMPGTKIGKGSIVSAYSLVSGKFPDYSIIKGNPAKVIGSTKDIDLPFLENHPEYKEFYFDREEIV
jgi:acetyltransferase-like isoleucine patch superfamily enzyme